MSETQKYNLVEKYKIDCWIFVVFMLACGIFAHI